ncbi:SDR family NAD(P)-dependent oxidoreductase [Zavarzinia sp. CC-PAN008]|uniref:SDR family NAD(P)-dependent oxidoreductase n=1 Tax=Zavarzinia sp. CC-PAN008 TaxID=3243332 RepID=UPI003F746406
MAAKGTAIVVGVGAHAGLGAALCRRFAREGLHVLAAGRTTRRVQAVVDALSDRGRDATAITLDTTDEGDVAALFRTAHQIGGGPPEIVVFNAGNNAPHDFRTMDAAFFETVWRVACFGGFLVGREAARTMVPAGRGSILFTGATASLRSRPPFTAFAAAKAGLRAIAQSMAREFGPANIHVAHVVIDGGIDGEKLHKAAPAMVEAKGEGGLLDPDDIAEAYWQLHRQPHTTWTFELDLRPFREPF